MKAIANKRGSIGVLLERKGMIMNHKKLYRLYTEEKLAVRRRRRLPTSAWITNTNAGGFAIACRQWIAKPVSLAQEWRASLMRLCGFTESPHALSRTMEPSSQAGRSWHSSLENQTPVEARRALDHFEATAHDALAVARFFIVAPASYSGGISYCSAHV